MNLLEFLIANKHRVFLATTGAGAGLQKILWEQPGSSSYFVGACMPYAMEELDAFLGFVPDKYCGRETALDMAVVAYMRAENDDPQAQPIGLAITAKVATTEVHKGEHHYHVAAITRDKSYVIDVTLPKGEGKMARKMDGMETDGIGFAMLDLASGRRTLDELNVENEFTFKDATEEILELVLKRPLFMRNGQRKKYPKFSPVLFPGNFNPPHEGHFANAALVKNVIFQVSVNPPHKDDLTLKDILDRVRWFRNKGDVLFLKDDCLYLDKARMFPGCSMVIGADALRRMLDPKWGVAVEPMLREFQSLGVLFHVCERDGDHWNRIRKDLKVPEWATHMFVPLPTTGLWGVSSTKIRGAQSNKKA